MKRSPYYYPFFVAVGAFIGSVASGDTAKVLGVDPLVAALGFGLSGFLVALAIQEWRR